MRSPRSPCRTTYPTHQSSTHNLPFNLQTCTWYTGACDQVLLNTKSLIMPHSTVAGPRYKITFTKCIQKYSNVSCSLESTVKKVPVDLSGSSPIDRSRCHDCRRNVRDKPRQSARVYSPIKKTAADGPLSPFLLQLLTHPNVIDIPVRAHVLRRIGHRKIEA